MAEPAFLAVDPDAPTFPTKYAQALAAAIIANGDFPTPEVVQQQIETALAGITPDEVTDGVMASVAGDPESLFSGELSATIDGRIAGQIPGLTGAELNAEAAGQVAPIIGKFTGKFTGVYIRAKTATATSAPAGSLDYDLIVGIGNDRFAVVELKLKTNNPPAYTYPLHQLGKSYIALGDMLVPEIAIHDEATVGSAWEYADDERPVSGGTSTFIGNIHGYEREDSLQVFLGDTATPTVMAAGQLLAPTNAPEIRVVRTSTLFHPDHGAEPTKTCVTTYTLDRNGLRVESAMTYLVAMQCSLAYAMLPTNGVNSTATKFDRAGFLANRDIVLPGTSDVRLGRSKSAALWLWPSAGKVAALVWLPDVSGFTEDWQKSAGTLVSVQDRAGALTKGYLAWIGTRGGAKTVPAGYVKTRVARYLFAYFPDGADAALSRGTGPDPDPLNPAPPPAGFVDEFDRPDSSSLGSNYLMSTNPAGGASNIGISGGAAVPSTGAASMFARHIAGYGHGTTHSTVKTVGTSHVFGILLRYVDENNYVLLIGRQSSSVFRYVVQQRVNGGSLTALGTSPSGIVSAAGDVLEIADLADNVITVKVNGVTAITVAATTQFADHKSRGLYFAGGNLDTAIERLAYAPAA